MSFYIKKIDIKEGVYKEKFLYGIWYKKINLNSYTITYRVLGLKFLTGRFDWGCPKLKLFNIISYKGTVNQTKKLLLPALLEYLKQNLNMNHYDVLPLYNRIGETYLTLHHIACFIKKNKIKNPVFISCYEHLKDLRKLFSFSIPFIKVPIAFRELYFVGIPNTEYKNLEYYEMVSHIHFIELEKKLQDGEKHKFYNKVVERLDVQGNPQSVTFNRETIESVDDKMKFLNIKRPFVYIVPHAQSIETLSRSFWDKLPLKLNNLGYDLFFNTIPYNVANSAYKHCYLSLDEAKYMCTKAFAIIGIRCGLMDVVLNSNSKIFCIYKDFKDRGKFQKLNVNIVIDAFTLGQLPEANKENIYEYNAEETDENTIMQDILLNLKRNKN